LRTIYSTEINTTYYKSQFTAKKRTFWKVSGMTMIPIHFTMKVY